MNILLCCSAGMSTSLLVTKMKKAAEEQGKEATINAVSASEVRNYVGEADVILLGPQIRYMLQDMKKIGEEYNIPVATIDQRDYGMVKGSAVLDHAQKLIDEGIES
ncbi:PTS sugar transporter subunit IIB [Oceanobacillus sojae]|uniref:Lichenan-specific phosphotransferase enzyme IIB component n=1 Tax=Oceanobacillus sojae TaxID=582851 RepID=A0A511ZI21_9BACI|nr:PTS sugar transporter subunit IIB [Oceanobacillus sojae]GEN87084.1 lichenan-specific phosphotransferase enzyme IIB component [Oceanobacillus sojae]